MDETMKNYGEIEEIIDNIEQRFKRIKKFDILDYPPYDHRFLNYDRNSKNMASESGFRQRIEKEWLLLENNLPSSILVKCYERRIDLIRAVIVGPPNTPYAHGLFFFDILFPRNYPNSPPRLHYHSYDLDLNPYLDPKGKVTLSLLECGNFVTNWYCGVEGKWNPQKSNILQVLIAIQTSILSTTRLNPSGVEGYKKAFTLTCKGMLYMLRESPMNFQDFVVGHFRTRAHYILLNYRKQMDNSDFMVGLFHELYRAFEQNGTYCKHHRLVIPTGADRPPIFRVHQLEKKVKIKAQRFEKTYYEFVRESNSFLMNRVVRSTHKREICLFLISNFCCLQNFSRRWAVGGGVIRADT